MPIYCEAGETARVTFPDGSVQDFDAPIDIECDIKDCTLVSFDYTVTRNDNGASFSGTSNSGYPHWFTIVGNNFVVNYYQCVDGVLTSTVISQSLIGWFFPEGATWTVNITSTTPTSSRKLTVKSIEGDVLFTSNYDSCNYSVECVAGCPANHLDCGDCCLPCDSIFNSISDIRSLVSRLR